MQGLSTLLSCPSLHPFPCTPQASHPDLFPLPPPAAALHYAASQELVCLLPCSSMFPACSYSFSLQQVAQLFLNKLKKYQTISGVMQCVPQKVKLMISEK